MEYRKYIKPAFFLLLILYIFSLWQRIPDVDDGWIGEHAYWMAKLGYVKSELMHGITQQHVRHIIHHKLFTLNGAAFISLFGFSLYTLKFVSLCWAVVFFLIFFKYTERKSDKETAWIAMLVLLLNAFIFQYSFVYRPEIMVMTLGFISFICVEKYLDEKKFVLLVPAGLMAGLAAAGHLNGLIYIGAGSLLLFWKKKPKAALWMGLFSAIGFSVYFYDFTRTYNLDYWIYQVKEAPSFIKSHVMPSSFDYFFKILREHLRFFHSPKEIILSLTLLFAIITNFRHLKNKTVYLHYLILLILLLSIITAHSTSKYLLLYMPVITLVIMDAVKRLFNSNWQQHYSKRLYTTGLVLLGGYTVIHLTYIIIISVSKYDTGKNAIITEKYFSHDSKELSILAPMDIIFNELPEYRRVQSDLSILELNGYMDVSAPVFFETTKKLDIQAIVLSNEFRKQFGLENYSGDDFLKEGFQVIGQEPGYLYLRKIN